MSKGEEDTGSGREGRKRGVFLVSCEEKERSIVFIRGGAGVEDDGCSFVAKPSLFEESVVESVVCVGCWSPGHQQRRGRGGETKPRQER